MTEHIERSDSATPIGDTAQGALCVRPLASGGASRLVELPPERIKDRTWTVYVCAEPDGQDCDSGTHPNILRHKCAALREWHEWHQAHPYDGEIDYGKDAPRGPIAAAIEVAPVNPEGFG